MAQVCCPIFRVANPFWSTQETNIWKNNIVLLLMVQVHNVPSKFGNKASAETGICMLIKGTHNLAENIWKRNLVAQNYAYKNAKKE